jgi:hypothetical protein
MGGARMTEMSSATLRAFLDDCLIQSFGLFFTCIYIGAVLRLVAGKQRIMRIPRVVRRRRPPAGSW